MPIDKTTDKVKDKSAGKTTGKESGELIDVNMIKRYHGFVYAAHVTNNRY